MIPWVAKGDSQALISQCVLLKKETIIKSYIPYTLCALTLCVHLSRCNRTTCWALGQGHPPHAAFCASSSAPNPSLWLLSAALLTQLWITCTEVFCLLMYIKLNANKWGAWGDLVSGRLKVELGKKKNQSYSPFHHFQCKMCLQTLSKLLSLSICRCFHFWNGDIWSFLAWWHFTSTGWL